MRLAVLITLIGLTWTAESDRDAKPSSTSEDHHRVKRQQNSLLGSVLQNNSNVFVNLGIRQDYLLQNCGNGDNLKLSFPDIDYSLLGYDILKSYPLALGSDPGFTYPIFFADYSEKTHTSDCRYSVPRGLVAIPDVSCDVSFTSSVIKNTRAFESELSTSASVSAGGWGVQFSASAGYKKATSEMSGGAYSFVISTAKCNYYTTKLQDIDHPKFDKSFLAWVVKLDKSTSDKDYVKFFYRYGTHYPTRVTFGARFTRQHKIETTTLEKMSSEGVNVAVSASYSGLFSVGGGFNMDSSERSKATDFNEKTETSTITVGAAPPANGDALTWASSVQQNPVPTSYELDAISNLFTETFMKDLNVDYGAIREKLMETRQLYWQSVQRQQGADDFQFNIEGSIIIPNWYVVGDYDQEDVTYGDCIKICQNLKGKCFGASFCKDCSWKSNSKCTIFGPNTRSNDWKFNEEWQTILMARELTLDGMAVVDPAGDTLEDIATYTRQSHGSLFDRAKMDCRGNFDRKGNTAMAYTFGLVFNDMFTFCKIYPPKRTLILEKRENFETRIKISG